jgi:RNA polymerase sigma-70 factor, ECF subfamily
MDTERVQDADDRAERQRDSVERRIPDALVRLAYGRLRQIAHGSMRRERAGHMLQTTALVNEAYLRLMKEVQNGRGADWSQRQLLSAAAEAMRRILVEQARCSKRTKRGGGWARVSFDNLEGVRADTSEPLDMLAVDEAVERLASIDPTMHEVVLLRFFAGLDIERVAELMGLSPSTIDREWRCARMWLYERITGDSAPASSGRSSPAAQNPESG